MLACPSCGSVYARSQEYCGLDGARLVQVDEDPLLGREVGRYVVEKLLGSGGMARVYQAKHAVLDRRVALKVLHGELSADQQLAKRFEREARSLSRIQHPHVVEVLDFGSTDAGALYMVMELVRGKTLADVLRRRGSLPPLEAAHLVGQITQGLQAAHRSGYVHRDLKPQNIVLDDSSGETLAKILDFGLVGMVEGEESDTPLTRQGTFFGTPTYMSPEQSAGERASPASDMYALGVVLYELLSGSPPFFGDVRQLAQQHLQKQPQPLPLPYDGLAEVAMALLAKEPKARPTTEILLERLALIDTGFAATLAPVSDGGVKVPSAPPRLGSSGKAPRTPSGRTLRGPPALATGKVLTPREDEKSPLAVPIERDEFSVLDGNSIVYEREALGPTRSGRVMLALLLLCGLAFGAYALLRPQGMLPMWGALVASELDGGALDAASTAADAGLSSAPSESSAPRTRTPPARVREDGGTADRTDRASAREKAAAAERKAATERKAAAEKAAAEKAAAEKAAAETSQPDTKAASTEPARSADTVSHDVVRNAFAVFMAKLDRHGLEPVDLGAEHADALERWDEWLEAGARVSDSALAEVRHELDAALGARVGEREQRVKSLLKALKGPVSQLPEGPGHIENLGLRARYRALLARAEAEATGNPNRLLADLEGLKRDVEARSVPSADALESAVDGLDIPTSSSAP